MSNPDTLILDSPAGVYEVATRSGSCYEFTLSGDKTATMRRLPAAVSPSSDRDAEALYGDDTALPVNDLRLSAGWPGFIVFVKADRVDEPGYVASTRMTTPVTRITKVS